MIEQTRVVMACLPTDRQLVEEMWLAAGFDLEECPKPTDLYTLGNCAYCQRSIWVGPRQQEMVKKTAAETWCYFCAAQNEEIMASPIKSLGGGHQTEGVTRWS